MEKQKTAFKQAPLPFVGQKRQFLTDFKQVLNDNIQHEGEGWTIVDVFGGSGLLAHTAKRLKPQARVIYNDFDGYAERLQNIANTNRLRQQIYAIVKETAKKTPLSKEKQAEIINLIQNFDGIIDLNTLSSWLLFSGNQISKIEELDKHRLWHSVPKIDYPLASGYLDGLEIISESFRTLIPKFSTQEKVLLLLDPPYLCTRQESYKQANYFDLIDFLHLISLTKPPFIFFSSSKSEFVRFINWTIEERQPQAEIFSDYKRITLNARVNYKGKYEDNLVYKF